MSKVKMEEKKEERELKTYSVVVEDMIDGNKKQQCLIVKILDPITLKYNMFESKVPKNSVLGREVAKILKQSKSVLKESLKKNK